MTATILQSKCCACGNVLLANSRSCSICGSAAPYVGTFGRIPATPQSVLANLNRHHFLVHSNCAACGYSGPLPKVDVQYPWYASIWVLLFLMATGIGVIAVVFIVWTTTGFKANYDLQCPVCKSRQAVSNEFVKATPANAVAN